MKVKKDIGCSLIEYDKYFKESKIEYRYITKVHYVS